jgi:hypothetical protein
MGFDPCNCSLKIQESTRTPTPKVEAHLGVWRFIPSHSLALPGACNVTPKLHTWPAPSQALALIASPKLGLWESMYVFFLTIWKSLQDFRGLWIFLTPKGTRFYKMSKPFGFQCFFLQKEIILSMASYCENSCQESKKWYYQQKLECSMWCGDDFRVTMLIAIVWVCP